MANIPGEENSVNRILISRKLVTTLFKLKRVGFDAAPKIRDSIYQYPSRRVSSAVK